MRGLFERECVCMTRCVTLCVTWCVTCVTTCVIRCVLVCDPVCDLVCDLVCDQVCEQMCDQVCDQMCDQVCLGRAGQNTIDQREHWGQKRGWQGTAAASHGWPGQRRGGGERAGQVRGEVRGCGVFGLSLTSWGEVRRCVCEVRHICEVTCVLVVPLPPPSRCA